MLHRDRTFSPKDLRYIFFCRLRPFVGFAEALFFFVFFFMVYFQFWNDSQNTYDRIKKFFVSNRLGKETIEERENIQLKRAYSKLPTHFFFTSYKGDTCTYKQLNIRSPRGHPQQIIFVDCPDKNRNKTNATDISIYCLGRWECPPR